MSKASSQKQNSLTDSKTTIHISNDPDNVFLEDDYDEDNTSRCVSRRLYLKPTHASGNLDKQVILKRIRRRKRMNLVKSTINSLFATKTTPPTGNSSPNKMRWIDDPFAAP
ncbi:hypothetical protein CTI12_AA431970 [Artemisia annua]|uniref:Uncharacterized protein n=1 Tax=Artemisia annua TaxID=35608 RepID=A0A2U1M052_ARTAN|nr:hypothetical protein CTI12_AA431970 [Artemisia annua]